MPEQEKGREKGGKYYRKQEENKASRVGDKEKGKREKTKLTVCVRNRRKREKVLFFFSVSAESSVAITFDPVKYFLISHGNGGVCTKHAYMYTDSV